MRVKLSLSVLISAQTAQLHRNGGTHLTSCCGYSLENFLPAMSDEQNKPNKSHVAFQVDFFSIFLCDCNNIQSLVSN
jgi:hypothetical protein